MRRRKQGCLHRSRQALFFLCFLHVSLQDVLHRCSPLTHVWGTWHESRRWQMQHISRDLLGQNRDTCWKAVKAERDPAMKQAWQGPGWGWWWAMQSAGACGCWWPPAGDWAQLQISQSLKHCTVMIASHSSWKTRSCCLNYVWVIEAIVTHIFLLLDIDMELRYNMVFKVLQNISLKWLEP